MTLTEQASLKAQNRAESMNDKAAANMARQVLAEQQVVRQQAQRAQEAAAIKQAGQQEGMAAMLANINPQGYDNVPGKEMGAGYGLPTAGGTNQQMYRRPAAPQEQGLWSTLLQKVGIK